MSPPVPTSEKGTGDILSRKEKNGLRLATWMLCCREKRRL
jgi:hypothetical protein